MIGVQDSFHETILCLVHCTAHTLHFLPSASLALRLLSFLARFILIHNKLVSYFAFAALSAAIFWNWFYFVGAAWDRDAVAFVACVVIGVSFGNFLGLHSGISRRSSHVVETLWNLATLISRLRVYRTVMHSKHLLVPANSVLRQGACLSSWTKHWKAVLFYHILKVSITRLKLFLIVGNTTLFLLLAFIPIRFQTIPQVIRCLLKSLLILGYIFFRQRLFGWL